jgi:hypothetical protein
VSPLITILIHGKDPSDPPILTEIRSVDGRCSMGRVVQSEGSATSRRRHQPAKARMLIA